jgi:hypothetical protein
MRAMRFQGAPIHDPAGGAAFADRERRDNDLRSAAVLLDRSGMTDQGDRLALYRADAAERIAAKGAIVACRRHIPLVAVSEQPVVGAVVSGGGRRKDEVAIFRSERGRAAFPRNENIGPLALRRATVSPIRMLSAFFAGMVTRAR